MAEKEGMSLVDLKQEAIRAGATGDYGVAAEFYSALLARMAETYDELGKDMAFIDVAYGCVLLLWARADKDETKKAVKCGAKGKDKDKGEDTIKSGAELKMVDDKKESTDYSDKKNESEDSEECEESDESEESDEPDKDMEESRLEQAWKVLEIARACFSKPEEANSIESLVMLMRIHELLSEIAAENFDYQVAVAEAQKALSFIEEGKIKGFAIWEMLIRIRIAAYWLKLKHDGEDKYKEQAIAQALMEIKSAIKVLECIQKGVHEVAPEIQQGFRALGRKVEEIKALEAETDDDVLQARCSTLAAMLMTTTGRTCDRLAFKFNETDIDMGTSDVKNVSVEDVLKPTLPQNDAASCSKAGSSTQVANFPSTSSDPRFPEQPSKATNISHLVRRKPAANAPIENEKQQSNGAKQVGADVAKKEVAEVLKRKAESPPKRSVASIVGHEAKRGKVCQD